jgi:hypothetical protein
MPSAAGLDELIRLGYQPRVLLILIYARLPRVLFRESERVLSPCAGASGDLGEQIEADPRKIVISKVY